MLAVVALMEAPSWGWGSTTTVMIGAAAVVVLIVFVWVERSVQEPLIDLQLFRNRAFTGSSLLLFASQSVALSTNIYGVVYLQEVYKLTPLIAGVAYLPAIVPALIAAPLAGRSVDRFDARLPTTIGSALSAVSFVLIALAVYYRSYLLLAPAFAAFAFTISFVFEPAFIAGINAVPATQRGEASGITRRCNRSVAPWGSRC